MSEVRRLIVASRRMKIWFLLSGLLVLSACTATHVKTSPIEHKQQITIIKGVRVFDGERIWPDATVVFRNERIVSINEGSEMDIVSDEKTDVIDGRGMTLLPGFLDAHFHVSGDINALKDSLQFGVTTVFDLFYPDQLLKEFRREVAKENPYSIADLYAAGTCATAPGGHGTQFYEGLDTIDSAEDAESWVTRRIKTGVNHIKIILEPGFTSKPLPTLDEATVRAIVQTAHENGLKVVAHVSHDHMARIATVAGADVLAHSWRDGFTEETLKVLKQNEVSVIATLSVYADKHNVTGPRSLLNDLRLYNRLDENGKAALGAPVLSSSITRGSNNSGRNPRFDLTVQLYQRDIAILAGTDAHNRRVWPGISMHREIELLVEAGLSPVAALRAATAGVADAFGYRDRGRIAARKLADMVLVSGDPAADIRNTRNIVAVWRKGRLIK